MTTPARLETHGLIVEFGGLRAIDAVSIAVEAGTVVGILGANGSGKTTLLDTISGQLRPTAGTVYLDDVDLIDYFPEDRSALGLVRSFQDCRLFPELTVFDTLMAAEDARRPVNALASTLRLPGARRLEAEHRRTVQELLTSFGLEAFSDRRIDQLSTGTRRIVDLAAIVAARPRLLLLDEPTAGIAQREAEAFGPLLRQVHEETGTTIVLVEHDVPLTVSLCDRLIVMEAGRVVSVGPTAEVLADPAAIEAYLGASGEALLRSGTSGPANDRPGPAKDRPGPANDRPGRRRRSPVASAQDVSSGSWAQRGSP